MLRIILYMAFSICFSTTYKVFDGDVLKIDYSAHGPTSLKIQGGTIKHIFAPSDSFEKFVSEGGQNVFITNVSSPDSATFFILTDGKTFGIEFGKMLDSSHVSHFISIENLAMYPDKIAQDILDGKKITGFEEKVLSTKYQSGSFFIKNLKSYSGHGICVYLAQVTNHSRKPQNLLHFSKDSRVLSFEAEKITLLPSQSTRVAFVFNGEDFRQTGEFL